MFIDKVAFKSGMAYIRQKITIISMNRPAQKNINQELQWFGSSLGLFNLRDKDKSTFRVFIELLKATKSGVSRLTLPKRLRPDCHKNSVGFENAYGRMAWNEIAPTMTSACTTLSSGRFGQDRQSFYPSIVFYVRTLGKARGEELGGRG